jgi:hypothetical protein
MEERKIIYMGAQKTNKKSHDEIESRKKTLDEVRLIENPDRYIDRLTDILGRIFNLQCCVLVA